MKHKIEEFLLIDELDINAVLLITMATVLSFPIGYWVVFAEFGWWMK